MNELLAKIEAALKKIEDRIGHYLEAKSAIPANAVLGNAVEPGLADELKEAKDALIELLVKVDALSSDGKLDAYEAKIEPYIKSYGDLKREFDESQAKIAELTAQIAASKSEPESNKIDDHK